MASNLCMNAFKNYNAFFSIENQTLPYSCLIQQCTVKSKLSVLVEFFFQNQYVHFRSPFNHSTMFQSVLTSSQGSTMFRFQLKLEFIDYRYSQYCITALTVVLLPLKSREIQKEIKKALYFLFRVTKCLIFLIQTLFRC